MDFFPLFARLDDRPCLVVGGGSVALRKTTQLRAAGARVTVNAPQLCVELRALAARGDIDWLPGSFDPVAIDGRVLVVAATDDEQVNEAVWQAATAAGRLVNVVDDPARCAFITPAVVDRSPVVVAVSSGGAAPVLARQLRARLETLLPARLGALASLAAGLRDRVCARLGTLAQRRRFWETVFDGPAATHAYAGRDDAAQREMLRALDLAGSRPPPSGSVSLVGAGPGDPGLLTLRALQTMQTADVIVHDRLVSDEVLGLARRDAERIDVGKMPGGCGATQDRINALIVERARRGQRVCRLKGGDPFVFGRGGEELEALVDAGIDFDVVPGITAATACAAYAGIPLTHRGMAQSVRFVTAHCERSLDCLDWPTLAADAQTVAFYMGVKTAGQLAHNLVAAGRDGATPVAIVERGTRPGQRVLTGRLDRLGDLVRQHHVRSPSIIIVGEVASLAGRYAWFAPRPDRAAQDSAEPPRAAALGGRLRRTKPLTVSRP